MHFTNLTSPLLCLQSAIFIGAATFALTASLACAQTVAPAAVAPVAVAPVAVAPVAVAPLRDAFAGQFLIGNAIDYPSLRGERTMEADIAARHFSALTAANSLKPSSVQPREGEFHFDEGDRFVDICEANNIAPIGHTLVWHSQSPDWYFVGPDGKPATRELELERLRTHIKTVVGRYKGRIKQWDVVNEAINDGPGVLRETPWFKALGPDYIAEAFRAAHEADPDAILVYNDYNIERGYKHPKAMELLRSLIAQKVPIDAVGIQCHWRMGSLNLPEVEKSIQDFAALGLKVMITEMDIGVLPTKYQGADISAVEKMTPEQVATMNPYTKGLPADVAAGQAREYREAFEMFLRHKDVIGRVTIWGVGDGNSWLNNFPVRGRTEYATLFDRAGQPKSAFFAVRDAALAAKNTPTTNQAQNPAPATTRYFGTAAIPSRRTDATSQTAHLQLIEKARKGGIDLYFLGDSITRRWGTSDAQWSKNLENWNRNFYGWNAANFGWGADGIQNMLWRIQNGELDGVHPKVIVILAGTNNVGSKTGDADKITSISDGVRALVDTTRQKAPNAKIIVTGIFPRNDNSAVMPEINAINAQIARLADGKTVYYLNVNDKLARADGTLLPGMTIDKLHLSPQGYQVWAAGLRPLLTQILGPRAATDTAPAPTGDPSAAKPNPMT